MVRQAGTPRQLLRRLGSRPGLPTTVHLQPLSKASNRSEAQPLLRRLQPARPLQRLVHRQAAKTVLRPVSSSLLHRRPKSPRLEQIASRRTQHLISRLHHGRRQELHRQKRKPMARWHRRRRLRCQQRIPQRCRLHLPHPNRTPKTRSPRRRRVTSRNLRQPLPQPVLRLRRKCQCNRPKTQWPRRH